jgi:serine/threonine protein phosphatase PrpC
MLPSPSVTRPPHSPPLTTHPALPHRQMDSGSLNGTTLNGAAVGRGTRQPGARVPLAHDDALEFGTATRCRLRCQPSCAARSGPSVLSNAGSPGAEARAVTWHGPARGASGAAGARKPIPSFGAAGAAQVGSGGGGSPSQPSPPSADRRASTSTTASGGTSATAAAAADAGRGGGAAATAAEDHNLSGNSIASGAAAAAPAPLEFSFPACGVEGAVLQRTGADHRRQGTGSEDVAFWEAPLRGHPLAGLFCVFDGHQGRGAAEEAASLLPAQLLEQLPAGAGGRLLGGGGATAPAIEAAFLEADRRLTSDEGCTATAVLVEAAGSSGDGGSSEASSGGVVLQVANVGDSEAILVDLSAAGAGGSSGSSGAAAPPWQQLTEDHRIATNPAEQARLAARSGHSVQSRLYGLNLARMLGDRFLKAEGIGFTARPHVGVQVEVAQGGDRAVVVASDGLWDVTSAERAAQLVARAVAAADEAAAAAVGGGAAGGGSGAAAAAAAAALMQHAVQQRSKDDVSVMVLRIRPGGAAAGGRGQ